MQDLMPDRELQPTNHEPSETELRAMLEARELELEHNRKRTSRKFSLVLAGLAVVIGAIIYLIPNKAPLHPPQIVKKAVPATTGDGIASDLKPFTTLPTDSDQKENIRFGMQLLNFMNSPTPKPAPPAKPNDSRKNP